MLGPLTATASTSGSPAAKEGKAEERVPEPTSAPEEEVGFEALLASGARGPQAPLGPAPQASLLTAGGWG